MRQTHDLICTECARVLEAGHKRCPVDGAKLIRRPRAAPGSVLARRYRLDAVLGQGGWATVFRARDLAENRDVAVQVLAPEQARGEDADARSDLYALGLILYEMLAGEPAYPRESAFLTLKRRLDGPPPSIRGKFPKLGVSEGLDEALRRLLAHSPDDRPQNAAAARALLARFGEPSGASHAKEPVETVDFPRRTGR